MTKILLLGGGYVLTKLAEHLPRDSFVITARSAENLAKFKALGFNTEYVDQTNANSLNSLILKYPSFSCIIDSIPVANQASFSVKQQMLATLNLATQSYIYLSTTGVYGERAGQWVNEETKCQPFSANAIERLAIENLYLKQIVPVTVCRISGIYGPQRGLGVSLQKCSYQLIEPSKWTNRIHVEDLAQGLLKLCYLEPERRPKIVNCSDSQPALAKEVVDFYCNKFNLAYPKQVQSTLKTKNTNDRLLLNQRVANNLFKYLLNGELKFPNYLLGAGSEYLM